MKTSFLTILALCLIINIVSGQSEIKPDFRKATWGMTHVQVKANETATLFKESPERISYSTTVLGMDVLIIYFFIDDKLTRAKYAFLSEHTNQNDYLIDFSTVNDALKSKYGDPKEEEFWSNELYKNDHSQWGFAISLGHYSKYAQWETDQTKIISALSGDNYKIHLSTEYSSKQFEELEKVKKKEKAKSDF